jgi:hypothetical protein
MRRILMSLVVLLFSVILVSPSYAARAVGCAGSGNTPNSEPGNSYLQAGGTYGFNSPACSPAVCHYNCGSGCHTTMTTGNGDYTFSPNAATGQCDPTNNAVLAA